MSGASLVNEARCNDAFMFRDGYFNAVSISLTPGAQGTGSIRYRIKDGDRKNFTRNKDNNNAGCNSPGINNDSCGILTVTVGATDLTVTSGSTAPAIDENSGAGQVIYTVTANATAGLYDTEPLIYSFAGGADDASFSIDSSNGQVTLVGDPDAEVKDSYSFDVKVADVGGNESAVQSVSLVINGLNDNDPVPQANSVTVVKGQSVTQSNLDTGNNLLQGLIDNDAGDTHSVNTVSASGPSNGTLVLSANGTFTYTHDGTGNLTDSFTFEAIDSSDNRGSASVSITVVEENDSDPVPQANSLTVAEGQSADQTDLDTGSNLLQGLTDADVADTHTVNTTPLVGPSNGTLSLSADGTFSYVHDGSENFSDSFRFEAIDSTGNTGSAMVMITVTEVNDNDPAPQANSVTVNQGESVTQSDLDTGTSLLQGLIDADSGDTHTVNTTPVSGTSSGTLVLAASGTFSYTHDGSANLTDAFTFQVIDSGGNTGDATVTITITIPAVDAAQPQAFDDHYSVFAGLVMEEDGGPITFNVLSNDQLGDEPAYVIRVGQQITDSEGIPRAWRTTSRLVDTSNTGDFSIAMNGEVSCSSDECLGGQTADSTLIGFTVGENSIIYRPGLNFNGEDSFTYCIRDAVHSPVDDSCATVTVLVTPANDLPRVPTEIVYTMDQGDGLFVSVGNGLGSVVDRIDNTVIDGLACDPSDLSCTRTSDTLYFSVTSLTTDQGGVLEAFNSDGTFTFRPTASFFGAEGFFFTVCDSAVPSAETCTDGNYVTIIVNEGGSAPTGSTDGVVEVDFDLAEIPLELLLGTEANVLVVHDDSGSMSWDILTEGESGKYRFGGNRALYTLSQATSNSYRYRAASEKAQTNTGYWRLRNSRYNKVYYNPNTRYEPWVGLAPGGLSYPPSNPASALHNPVSPNGSSTNLLDNQQYTAYGSNGNYTNVNLYLPRYYVWVNKDASEVNPDLDATPSPYKGSDASYCVRTWPIDAVNEARCLSDGLLVEIKPASQGGSDSYPRPESRTDCVTSDNSCSFQEELQNFANWFTYSRTREFTAKSALGRVIAGSENLRVGFTTLRPTRPNEPIRTMNSSERTGAKADLLNTIYETYSSGGTPLRQALRGAGRHFACKSGDIYGSSSNSAPGDSACPVLAAPNGNCQQNFTLLISDGAWNGSSPSIGNSDNNNNTDFDGGVYAGGASDTLADVAMKYYEEDIHPGLQDEVQTSARDIAGAAEDAFRDNSNVLMHQHMKTFTVGFGVNGLVEEEDVPTNYTTTFNWGNPTNSESKIDDMRHAALNGRGQYLSAANPLEFSEALEKAFAEFQQGSGAASAVSFNSQEILQDTLVFRSFYNTKTNTGDLIAQRISPDGVVTEEPVWEAATQLDAIAPSDRVILTYNGQDGIPFRPAALNADQRAAFSVAPGGDPIDTVISQRVSYLRGDNANERPVGNFRERPGIAGRLGDIVHSAPTFIGPPSRLRRGSAPFPEGAGLYSQFRFDNKDRESVIYVAANDGMLHGFHAETGDEVVGYLPNNLITGTYSNRVTNLLDYQYTHKYFVDSTPAINDVYLDVDGDGDKEWRTILVSGQGGGGKAYSALDITDPTAFADLNSQEVVLWEFTDEDDTYPTDGLGNPLLTDADGDGDVDDQRQDRLSPSQPVKDLGYTLSVPTIVMSNMLDDDFENIWVAVAGNGYNSTAGIAKLLVMFLEGGLDGTWCHPDVNHNVIPNGSYPTDCQDGDQQDFVKLDTGFGALTGVPNGLGEPRLIDADGNGTADYAYAGDLQGNFFRFDITDADFNNWSVTKIFKAQYKPGTADEKNQPITTQPLAIVHPTEDEGFIIIFGTGAYLRNGDSTDAETQSIYGIWDRLGSALVLKSELQPQSYTNVDDALGKLRTLSEDDVDYTVAGSQKGWYNDLDSPAAGALPGSPAELPGERAVRNIQLRGGIAFVNSIFPREAGSCVGLAGGAVLSFCPATGGSICFNRTVFDLNDDGTFDGSDDIGGVYTAAGIILEDPSPPTDSTFIDNKRVTQYGRELHIISTNTSVSGNTGRLSWKRLETVD
jgi:type IV pilus assembly protein PilY1